MFRRTVRRGPSRWALIPLAACLLLAVGCQVAGQAAPDPAGLAALASAGSSSSSTGITRATATSAPGTTDGGDRSVPATTDTRTTSGPGRSLIIATDGYFISRLISAIWSQGLEAKGYRVGVRTFDDVKAELTAIEAGQVDIVLGFDGELLYELDPENTACERGRIDAELSDKVPSGTKVLRSAEADDRTVLITSKSSAAKYRLTSLEDLAGVTKSALILARPDDEPGAKELPAQLAAAYGVAVAKTVPGDYGGPKTFAALKAGTALLGVGSNCQYRIDTEQLVSLEDPAGLYSAQHPVPLVQHDLARDAETQLDAISAKLTTSVVRALELKLHNSPGASERIAKDWLDSQGLR